MKNPEVEQLERDIQELKKDIKNKTVELETQVTKNTFLKEKMSATAKELEVIQAQKEQVQETLRVRTDELSKAKKDRDNCVVISITLLFLIFLLVVAIISTN